VRKLLWAALLCMVASPAFAQVCPIGSTCNPWETYIYGKGAASQPFAGSLKIPAVPNSTASSAQFIAANLFADLTSAQTLTSKTFTSPTINGATLSGTIAGSFTLSGVPIFSGLSSGTQTRCLGLDSGNNLVTSAGACGSGGGGSGTVASSTIGQLPVYTAATTVTGTPNLTFSSGLLVLNTVAGTPAFPTFASGPQLFTLAAPNGTQTRVSEVTYGNVSGSVINMVGAAGTGASPTALASGSAMGSLQFAGYDGTNITHSARIAGVATENQTPSAHGSKLVFGVTPIGSTTLTDTMFLDSGNLTLDLNAANVFPSFAAGIPQLLMVGPDAAQTRMSQLSFGNTGGSIITMSAAGGTGGSPTPLASGNFAGSLQFAGYDGTNITHSARIGGVAAQTQAGGAHGMNVVISTTPIGSTTLTDALTIGSDQNITVAGQAGSGVRCIHVDSTGKQSPTSGDCGTGGSGSVTSVTLSSPGGIFAATGTNPITTSGTFGYSTTGTSGGIPYFSSGSQLSSSGALAQYGTVIGGGPGAAPVTVPPNSAGFVLTSNGGAANPTFQAATGGGLNQLTGDVTAGPGTGSQAATIAANAVTNAKAAQMAANTLKGNPTGSTANASDIAIPSCPDTGGNHLNWVSGTGPTCGTSGGGGGTAALSYGTIAGGPTAYTIASPTPAVSSNVANYVVCASIPTSVTANTGAATLAVGTAGALALQKNTNGGGLAFAGGEFPGAAGEVQTCFKTNSGATAWVMIANPGGGTLVNPSGHAITQNEWANNQFFLCTVACSLTMPNLASTTLSANAGPTVVTVGVVATITSLGTDGIDNGQVGGIGTAGTFYIPADMTAPMFTSGAAGAGAYSIPIGPVQYFPFSWLPGMDLSTATAGIRVGRFATPRILYAIRCNIDLAAGAAQTMIFKDQTASGLISAGTTINSGSFNMNGTPGTEVSVALTSTPLLVPTDYWLGAVVTGSATAGSGACQFTFR